MRIRGVRQHDATDCGPACLAAIARGFGIRVPIARIRQDASTDRGGTNVLGIVQAAERLGFTAQAVRGTPEALDAAPLPAIAHVTQPRGAHHFVVLVGVAPGRVRVMDPEDGRLRRIDRDEFLGRWTGVLVLVEPAAGLEPLVTPSPAARLARLVLQHRSAVAQALLGSAAYTLLGVSGAVFVQKIVDGVLVDGDAGLLNLLGVGMVAMLVAQVALGLSKGRTVIGVGQRIDGELLLGYYRHVLRLPQRFFDSMRVGEVVSRVGDAVKIRTLVGDVLVDLAVSAGVVVLSLGLVFAYSWRLGLVAAAALPLYAATWWAADLRNRRHQRAAMERAADLESHLVASLTGATTIKRFGLEGVSTEEAEARLVRLLVEIRRTALTSLAADTTGAAVSRGLAIGVLWIGAWLVLQHDLTPGQLMSCHTLAGYLSGPMSRLVRTGGVVRDALIASDRLFEIMDLQPDDARPGVVPGPDRPTGIALEDVHFAYGSRPPVYRGLSLELEAGTVTGIVGESGSGKSTLVGLLQRLYPAGAGRVRIAGVDVRDLDAGWLRRSIVAVPQDVTILPGTVVENIAAGILDPDLGALLDLCSRLGLLELVDSLPEGFHTRLGDRGAMLSGGERQRLGIARALFRQPRVLLLDEATSALDAASEERVQRVLRDFVSGGGTGVVIAHRLATVRAAARIVVLERGRVVEEGTHEELMTHDARYARLWRLQHGSPAGERKAA